MRSVQVPGMVQRELSDSSSNRHTEEVPTPMRWHEVLSFVSFRITTTANGIHALSNGLLQVASHCLGQGKVEYQSVERQRWYPRKLGIQ